MLKRNLRMRVYQRKHRAMRLLLMATLWRLKKAKKMLLMESRRYVHFTMFSLLCPSY